MKNFINFLKPIGFSFEILLNYYLISLFYFLSQKFKLKWSTNYASTIIHSKFPSNNDFCTAEFNYIEYIIVVNSKFQLNNFLMVTFSYGGGEIKEAIYW